jgi:serine/threonine protein kinase
MNTHSKCPDSVRWNELLDSGMPEAEAAWLSKHLDRCADCQSTLEQLTAGEASWAEAAAQVREESPRPELRRAMEQLKASGEAGLETVAPTAVGDATLPFLRASKNPEQLGRLGAYEVLEVIGRGGMGVVLKAFDPALRRMTAIKVLAPQWASHAEARQRFEREARAAAKVRHENVVAIHAVDAVDGLPYLVMEYVPGMSLQQRLDKGGPLALEEILAIGSQAAAGLAAAHEQDLIHRDIKPANILLDSAGNVRLTDFGLARAVDDASLTQTGVIAGTPQYMAPEQARAAPLDHRADLFSLGSVLYAACTGQPPFRAPTTIAVLKRLCEDKPRDVCDLNPDIPDWLADIIDKLHAKRPCDRFYSADEVARLLSQYLRHLRAPDTVKKPRPLGRPGPWRPWVGWAAGLFVAVAVGVSLTIAGVVLWLHRVPEANVQPPPPRAQDNPLFQKIRADLDNGDVFKRRDALMRLATMQPNDQRAEIATKLVALAENDNPFIRQAAVAALGVWGTAKEVPALVQALEHPDVFTRREALKVIGRFRDPQTLDPVIRCFREFRTRADADMALRELGAMAEKDVLALLKEHDVFLKKAAIQVLTDIGSEASVPALQQAAASGNIHLAPSAQQALTAIAARQKN